MGACPCSCRASSVEHGAWPDERPVRDRSIRPVVTVRPPPLRVAASGPLEPHVHLSGRSLTLPDVINDVRERSRFNTWLLEAEQQPDPGGFYEGEQEATAHHHVKPWWKVMCLTGVDYFSTLGYQPGIAALAAGALAPIATLVLVLVTLFGALPMYRRVAKESPHGDGSLSMLERLLSYWPSKVLVLSLIGFVATGFIITITLSAADASAHLVENPFLTEALHGQEVWLTLVLLALLGAVFLKGFGEAIGIAVVLVAGYIGLSAVVVANGFWHIAREPRHLHRLDQRRHRRPRLPAGGARRLAARVPRPGAGPVGLRDRRGGDAAGQGRPRRHARRADGPDPQREEAADHGRAHHVGDADGLGDRHHVPHPRGRVRARRGGQRTRAGLPGAREPRRRVRHRLRHRHHRHPVVRRGLGHGRAAQHRAPLPAPLRHGAGLGPRHPPPRAGVHRSSPSSSPSRSTPTWTPRPAPTPPACWR